MERIAQILVSLLVIGYRGTDAYPKGPPTKACAGMYPTGHKVDAQTSNSIVNIKLTDATGKEKKTYKAGDKITVTVATSDPQNDTVYFKGLFVQVRRANCSSDKKSQAVGTFAVDANSDFLKLMSCQDVTGSAVSQKNNTKQTSQTFTWTAPTPTVGPVYIQATVVKNVNVFWTGVTSGFLKDDDMSVPKYCEVRKKYKVNSATDVKSSLVAVVLLGIGMTVANSISLL